MECCAGNATCRRAAQVGPTRLRRGGAPENGAGLLQIWQRGPNQAACPAGTAAAPAAPPAPRTTAPRAPGAAPEQAPAHPAPLADCTSGQNPAAHVQNLSPTSTPRPLANCTYKEPVPTCSDSMRGWASGAPGAARAQTRRAAARQPPPPAPRCGRRAARRPCSSSDVAACRPPGGATGLACAWTPCAWFWGGTHKVWGQPAATQTTCLLRARQGKRHLLR